MIEGDKAAIVPYPVWAKAIRSLPTIRISGWARRLTLNWNVLIRILGEADAGLGRLEQHVLFITFQRPRLAHNWKKRLFNVILK